MKKLFGLAALASVLVLAACGGNDNSGNNGETVCRTESPEGEVIVRVQSEDGEITSGTMEIRMDYSDLEEEEREMMAELMDAELDGDILIISQDLPIEMLEDTSLETFIEEAETDGATCN